MFGQNMWKSSVGWYATPLPSNITWCERKSIYMCVVFKSPTTTIKMMIMWLLLNPKASLVCLVLNHLSQTNSPALCCCLQVSLASKLCHHAGRIDYLGQWKETLELESMTGDFFYWLILMSIFWEHFSAYIIDWLWPSACRKRMPDSLMMPPLFSKRTPSSVHQVFHPWLSRV